MKEETVKSYKKQRHSPLEQQIVSDGVVKARKIPRKKLRDESRADADEEFVSSKMSKKILSEARKQQAEVEDISKYTERKKASLFGEPNVDDEDEEDQSDSEILSEINDDIPYEDFNVDENDEKALGMFLPTSTSQRRTLGDIIANKIRERETEICSQMSEGPNSKTHLSPKVVEVYANVGALLKKYRSGKLPKAFKIIPALSNWEEILYLTNPDEWSAASMYQATKLFASNLNAKMAQRFFNQILLPRVRDDIAEYKKLNYHLYMALKKALYKPAAFFKGILIPLCECGTTLREAIIFGSVLSKVSVPVLHSAACMLKIAELDYTGASSIFLRVLIDKKYALPFRTIDAVVFHFLRFLSDKRDMPVLWHQCLLAFVQRYKEDICVEQKEALLDLLKVHNHDKMTPEIRREIVHSKSRDVEDIFQSEEMQM